MESLWLLLRIALVLAIAIAAIPAMLRYRRELPVALAKLADELDGKVLRPNLFRSRPMIMGSFRDRPAELMFPEEGAVRIRIGATSALRCRIRSAHAHDDLLGVGVPPDEIDGAQLGTMLTRLFDGPGGTLVIRGGRARLTIGGLGRAATLPPRVMAALEAIESVVGFIERYAVQRG